MTLRIIKRLKSLSPFPFSKGDILIDISDHNGNIDFAAVAADPQKIKGVFIKASEGATFMTRTFLTNVAGCKANGLPWGAYHFATWNNNQNVKEDAEAEARFLISTVKKANALPDLPLMLDIESNNPIPYTKAQMVEFVKSFTDVVKKDYEIGVYSGPGFLQSYLPNDHPFNAIKLWIADYDGAINPIPGGWKPFLRQYTDKGRVNGISADVDMNIVL